MAGFPRENGDVRNDVRASVAASIVFQLETTEILFSFSIGNFFQTLGRTSYVPEIWNFLIKRCVQISNYETDER